MIMDTLICKTCNTEKPISEYYQENRGFIRKSCKSCEKAKSAAYKSANREKVRAGFRDYNRRNAEKRRNYQIEYLAKQKDYVAQRAKDYWSKPENRTRKATNKRVKYQTNIQFKILDNCRSRIFKAIKHNRKTKSTLELIGCSLEQLKSHLENQFQSGMNWDNHGEWHIDHIKPCASFDLSIPDEQKKCFHYTNLQPLWAIDNILKRDNY